MGQIDDKGRGRGMKKQPAISRTSLEFDRDLWVAFKVVVLREGKTATEVIEKFIRKYVADRESKGGTR